MIASRTICNQRSFDITQAFEQPSDSRQTLNSSTKLNGAQSPMQKYACPLVMPTLLPDLSCSACLPSSAALLQSQELLCKPICLLSLMTKQKKKELYATFFFFFFL
jgi:hypothetical protein